MLKTFAFNGRSSKQHHSSNINVQETLYVTSSIWSTKLRKVPLSIGQSSVLIWARCPYTDRNVYSLHSFSVNDIITGAGAISSKDLSVLWWQGNLSCNTSSSTWASRPCRSMMTWLSQARAISLSQETLLLSSLALHVVVPPFSIMFPSDLPLARKVGGMYVL